MVRTLCLKETKHDVELKAKVALMLEKAGGAELAAEELGELFGRRMCT